MPAGCVWHACTPERLRPSASSGPSGGEKPDAVTAGQGHWDSAHARAGAGVALPFVRRRRDHARARKGGRWPPNRIGVRPAGAGGVRFRGNAAPRTTPARAARAEVDGVLEPSTGGVARPLRPRARAAGRTARTSVSPACQARGCSGSERWGITRRTAGHVLRAAKCKPLYSMSVDPESRTEWFIES